MKNVFLFLLIVNKVLSESSTISCFLMRKSSHTIKSKNIVHVFVGFFHKQQFDVISMYNRNDDDLSKDIYINDISINILLTIFTVCETSGLFLIMNFFVSRTYKKTSWSVMQSWSSTCRFWSNITSCWPSQIMCTFPHSNSVNEIWVRTAVFTPKFDCWFSLVHMT